MTNFGKYDLLERLASGGMAELFLARQTGVGGFSKTVVIKRIHKHLSADYEFTTMFINEARVSAQLSHQNIVQVYDFGEHDGSYFIAMEYVFGQDLKNIYKLCRKKRLQMPLPLAIYIIQQVCKGLDYAHRKKDAKGRPLDIVHRDVSPQNVLLSYEGEVKVADFGIAKAASSSRMTQAGTLKGKIAYMSPEQAWGKAVDKRSDIFSIGIVFWEILTNQRLFFGNSDFDTLERVRNSEIPDIGQYVPSVSKEIDRILRKALAKEMEPRYQTAAEMHHDLEVFSAAHGFYNQSPELANFLRAQFLQSDDSEEGSSGSHPRVLTSDGALHESSQPLETIERGDSSAKIQAPPGPSSLPAVAQQVVAQARDATRQPPQRPVQDEDDTYQAPPLSDDLLQEAAAAVRSGPERSGSRPTEASGSRHREGTGANPNASASVKGAPPETAKRPVVKEEAPVGVEEKQDESKRPTKRVPAAKEKAQEPVEEVEETAEDAAEEDWDEEEWEESEAPRSSALVAVLAIFLFVAIGVVGAVGFYVLRQKGILLPPSWLPPGRVLVQTIPDAEVFVASELKGKADPSGRLTVNGLIGGSYDLKVAKAGYTDLTRRVRVRPNKGVAVVAYPDALRGKLTVDSNEAAARVYVDGVYYSRTAATKNAAGSYSVTLDAVLPGERVVTVGKTDRRDSETKLNVPAEGTATASAQLAPGTTEWVELTVESNQPKSFMILDGEFKGPLSPGTPFALRIEQGMHDLAVVKANFDPVVFRRKNWTKEALKVELKPAVETGSLKIVTTAEDYHVLVDSREILHRIAREATLPGIPQGKHTVRFVHATLGTQEKEVILSAGDIESVTFDLAGAEKK